MSISARPPYATAFARRQRISRSTFCFRLLHGGNIAAFLVQLAIGFNYDNIIASVIVFFSASLMLSYLQFTHAFQERMISSFMLLGYCITTHFGALILQSASFTPLVEGLRMPSYTFGNLAGLQIVAILAHWIFRKINALNGLSDSIGTRILKPLGLFMVPTPKHLWILGFIGFAANMGSASAGGNVIGKAIDAIRFIAWAPFLIPVFAARYGDSYCNKRKQYFFIALFIFASVLLSMALNFRGLMFIGPLTGTMIFLAYAFRDVTPLGKHAYLKFLITIAIGALGVQAANYVAVAMVSIRNQIEVSTRTEMIGKTFDILMDPSRVEKQAKAFNYDAALGLFDEKYLSSPTLARFVETKFIDNSFYFGYALSDSAQDELIDTTINQLISILPEPIIKWLKIDVDKYASFFSAGDTLLFLSAGIPKGGFTSGSALAQGISVFGYYFYPIFFLLSIVILVAYESLGRTVAGHQPEISTLAFLNMALIFQHGLTYENLLSMMGMFRTLPQNIILYSLIFGMVRVFSPPYRSE
jgi:hypothetical protein